MYPNLIRSWQALIVADAEAKETLRDAVAANFRMPGWYTLHDDGNITPVDHWEANDILGDIDRRRVGYSEIDVDGRVAIVSTVFLVLDHGYRGRTQLFETMVSGCENRGDITGRYADLPSAKMGHYREVAETALAMVAGLPPQTPVWRNLAVRHHRTRFLPAYETDINLRETSVAELHTALAFDRAAGAAAGRIQNG